MLYGAVRYGVSVTGESDRYLWVSDICDHRLIEIDTYDTADREYVGGESSGGEWTHNVLADDLVPSPAGFVSGHQFMAQFHAPAGLCADPTQSGRSERVVFVADMHNSAIREIRRISDSETKLAVERSQLSASELAAQKKQDIAAALAVYVKPPLRPRRLSTDTSEKDRL